MPLSSRRFGAFAAVGALGFVVQLGVLAVLTSFARWTWLPATLVSVELAVIHNYIWHERWTWNERRGRPTLSLARLVRFHIANGLASTAGNVLLMWLLVALAGMPPVPANVVAVALMSALNFVMADRWVFGAAAVVLLATPTAAVAAPTRETVTAWDRYVAATEGRLEDAVGGRHAVAQDTITASGESIGVPSGTISHWRGTVFVAGTTVTGLLDKLMHPGTPPPQEDVLSSRVVSRGADSLHVYIRLVRHAIVTVVYDTEHDMQFRRRSATVATAKSIATRIEEVGGTDHGFLWRLHSYWRYEETAGGVLVELDSITLSRDVPAFVRTIASPLVNRIARESTCRTLDALRRYFQPA
jgi:putative flippase GtrA